MGGQDTHPIHTHPAHLMGWSDGEIGKNQEKSESGGEKEGMD